MKFMTLKDKRQSLIGFYKGVNDEFWLDVSDEFIKHCNSLDVKSDHKIKDLIRRHISKLT